MFRTAIESDCKDVYQMICDMEAKVLPYEKFYSIYKRQLSDIRYECIICEENENVIGVLNLRYEEQLHHTELIAEIMEFVVASGYRGEGYGKKMFNYACECARNNNCTQIEVTCNQLRKDTHRFYLREGMVNSHFKFSKRLVGDDLQKNVLGR